MTEPMRSAVRAAVIAAGLAVNVASAFAFRSQDWAIYLVFVPLWLFLNRPGVAVMPNMQLPVANIAATIGFLYIGGAPIIALQFALLLAIASSPEFVRARLGVRHFGRVGMHDVPRATMLADWSDFTLGLGARWWVASSLVPDGNVTAHPAVILLAELAGYTSSALLSVLPIYSFGPLPGLRPRDAATRELYGDMGLVVILSLTPFVFLTAYGYQTGGLAVATVWSLAALGQHFVLKRLNERRLRVEEQKLRLEALQRELAHRERLSAIGKMSSVVSHQILQQLGVIGLYADLIRNAADDGDAAGRLARVRTDAGAIEQALASVNGVLRDLLVFSKDQRVNLYEHALAAVVDDALESCRPVAAARGVTLRADVPAALRLSLDKLKVQQALANLVRNAIEASPPGGLVEVRAARVDGGVEVAVADQGAGVAAGDRDAVFAPFFTTKEQGTGLGLAIAREFALAHGGDLRLADGDGRGATFVLRLPCGDAASPSRTGHAG
jgi:signal transduction histidine kinase